MHSVYLGQNVTLPCVYDSPGMLRSRYRIEWHRGQRMLLRGNSRSEFSQRYVLNEDDFSLTIHNATLEDASGAYYCAVHVENILGNNFYQVGPTFTLEVNSKPLDSLTGACHVDLVVGSLL